MGFTIISPMAPKRAKKSASPSGGAAKKRVSASVSGASVRDAGANGKSVRDAGVNGASVSPVEMAHALRVLAMDAVERAGSGHPGMPMGAADIATVLFTRFFNFDPRAPSWHDRDRFILSAGHGSMLLYGLLYLLGVEDIALGDLQSYRRLGSKTPGHPELGCAAGVEMTTGPLGQGIGGAVGMALAERVLNAEFGDALIRHRTYVLASDGDLMEGLSHEAISLAGHLKLSGLVVLHDDNRVTIDGALSLSDSSDAAARFAAAGWHSRRVDGHNHEKIGQAIEKALESDLPTFISCRTKIGYGAPNKEGDAASHGAPLGAEEAAGARKRLRWPAPPFEIPGPILDAWRLAGLRGAKAHHAWEKRFLSLGEEKQAEFRHRLSAALPDGLSRSVSALKRRFLKEKEESATRRASGAVLEKLASDIPALLGGSADLTGSNNARASSQSVLSAQNYGGRFLHYGVREHGMAAVMNGLALHGGFIPYGGTFLVFSDYCRPALRLSALMGLRVIYLFTHDSIGLGEDGPTHQPVEHLASLRAIPNLSVFRPADAVETAECWEAALRNAKGPSALILTRQNVPAVRTQDENGNQSARGAYEIAESDGEADITFLATGSEVSVAMEARRILSLDNLQARVVSMPCWEFFAAQDEDYRKSVLGASSARIAIEAAGEMGWRRYLGEDGLFIGMEGFGASGAGEVLFEHFGITAEAAAEAARALLARKRG